mmetsp:Transcript_8395/g.7421  ORF Transcript_8395/g.7421 Transcript_8395/m.7421 type:complete len:115 (-) Transcript_8395:46-390(-)
MDFRQFAKVVSSFKLINNRMSICNCSILNKNNFILGINRLNLKHALVNSNFERINLNSSGSIDRSNWISNPERFENIINFLKESDDINKKLKEVWVDDKIVRFDKIHQYVNEIK